MFLKMSSPDPVLSPVDLRPVLDSVPPVLRRTLAMHQAVVNKRRRMLRKVKDLEVLQVVNGGKKSLKFKGSE